MGKHLQVDEILDQAQACDDDKAKIIKSCRENGTQIPDDLVNSCLKETIKKQGWEKSNFLLNGFPRSVDQFKSFEKFMGTGVNIKGILYLKCNQNSSFERSKTGMEEGAQKKEDFNAQNSEMKTLL